MKRNELIVIALALLIILSILGYYFLYNIYEVKVEINPKQLYADTNSQIEIRLIPINALGFNALFRTTECKFEIVEGKDLIEVISDSSSNCAMTIKSKGIEGKVGIKIYCKHSLFPQYIEILIMPLRV